MEIKNAASAKGMLNQLYQKLKAPVMPTFTTWGGGSHSPWQCSIKLPGFKWEGRTIEEVTFGSQGQNRKAAEQAAAKLAVEFLEERNMIIVVEEMSLPTQQSQQQQQQQQPVQQLEQLTPQQQAELLRQQQQQIQQLQAALAGWGAPSTAGLIPALGGPVQQTAAAPVLPLQQRLQPPALTQLAAPLLQVAAAVATGAGACTPSSNGHMPSSSAAAPSSKRQKLSNGTKSSAVEPSADFNALEHRVLRELEAAAPNGCTLIDLATKLLGGPQHKDKVSHVLFDRLQRKKQAALCPGNPPAWHAITTAETAPAAPAQTQQAASSGQDKAQSTFELPALEPEDLVLESRLLAELLRAHPFPMSTATLVAIIPVRPEKHAMAGLLLKHKLLANGLVAAATSSDGCQAWRTTQKAVDAARSKLAASRLNLSQQAGHKAAGRTGAAATGGLAAAAGAVAAAGAIEAGSRPAASNGGNILTSAV